MGDAVTTDDFDNATDRVVQTLAGVLTQTGTATGDALVALTVRNPTIWNFGANGQGGSADLAALDAMIADALANMTSAPRRWAAGPIDVAALIPGPNTMDVMESLRHVFAAAWPDGTTFVFSGKRAWKFLSRPSVTGPLLEYLSLPRICTLRWDEGVDWDCSGLPNNNASSPVLLGAQGQYGAPVAVDGGVAVGADAIPVSAAAAAAFATVKRGARALLRCSSRMWEPERIGSFSNGDSYCAPIWRASTSYEVGDVVTYDDPATAEIGGPIYICKLKHESLAAFTTNTTTYWQAYTFPATTPMWAANTAYALGAHVNAPDGFTYRCVAAHTSDSSLAATNWKKTYFSARAESVRIKGVTSDNKVLLLDAVRDTYRSDASPILVPILDEPCVTLENPHAIGPGLHPTSSALNSAATWASGTAYVTGSTPSVVKYTSANRTLVYRCILGHTSSSEVTPLDPEHWVLSSIVDDRFLSLELTRGCKIEGGYIRDFKTVTWFGSYEGAIRGLTYDCSDMEGDPGGGIVLSDDTQNAVIEDVTANGGSQQCMLSPTTRRYGVTQGVAIVRFTSNRAGTAAIATHGMNKDISIVDVAVNASRRYGLDIRAADVTVSGGGVDGCVAAAVLLRTGAINFKLGSFRIQHAVSGIVLEDTAPSTADPYLDAIPRGYQIENVWMSDIGGKGTYGGIRFVYSQSHGGVRPGLENYNFRNILIELTVNQDPENTSVYYQPRGVELGGKCIDPELRNIKVKAYLEPTDPNYMPKGSPLYLHDAVDAWSSTVYYKNGNLVKRNGTNYICIASNNNKDPSASANSSYWSVNNLALGSVNPKIVDYTWAPTMNDPALTYVSGLLDMRRSWPIGKVGSGQRRLTDTPVTLGPYELDQNFNNFGASALVVVMLPPAVSGLRSGRFFVVAAAGIRLSAAAGDTIQVGSALMPSGSLTATAQGAWIEVEAIDTTKWIARVDNAGNWT